MQGVTSLRQHERAGRSRSCRSSRRSTAARSRARGSSSAAALFMSDEQLRRLRRSSAHAGRRHAVRCATSSRTTSSRDVDADTDAYRGPTSTTGSCYMSGEKFDGKNDFTDDELRRSSIDKAHKLGKMVDVHCGGHNDGLRRMLAFDVDTLEHPFYGNQLDRRRTSSRATSRRASSSTRSSRVMIVGAQRAADPHRFDETLYAMSMDPKEHRILMQYRDTMLAQPEEADRARRCRSTTPRGRPTSRSCRRTGTRRSNTTRPGAGRLRPSSRSSWRRRRRTCGASSRPARSSRWAPTPARS